MYTEFAGKDYGEDLPQTYGKADLYSCPEGPYYTVMSTQLKFYTDTCILEQCFHQDFLNAARGPYC